MRNGYFEKNTIAHSSNNDIFLYLISFVIFLINLLLCGFFLREGLPALIVGGLIFNSIILFMSPKFRPLALILLNVNMLICILMYFSFTDAYGAPYFNGGSDDLAYEQDAFSVVRYLNWDEYSDISGNIVSQYHNSVGYVYFISLIIRLLDSITPYHTLFPRFLNSFFLVLICLSVFNMCVDLLKVDVRRARIYAFILGLIPVFMWNSGLIFREVLVTLLLTHGLFFIMKPVNKLYKYVEKVLIIVTYYVILLTLREFAAFLFIILSVIILGFGIKIKNVNLRYMTYGIWVCGILLVGYRFFQIYGVEIFNQANFYYESYSGYRGELAQGFSSFIFFAPEPVASILKCLFYFIVPFPALKIPSTLEEVVPLFNCLIFISFYLYLMRNLKIIIKSRNIYLKVIFFVFLVIYIGMAIYSFSPRQIVMWYPFLICLLAYISQQRGRWLNNEDTNVG